MQKMFIGDSFFLAQLFIVLHVLSTKNHIIITRRINRHISKYCSGQKRATQLVKTAFKQAKAPDFSEALISLTLAVLTFPGRLQPSIISIDLFCF
jgi:hypothetical protein